MGVVCCLDEAQVQLAMVHVRAMPALALTGKVYKTPMHREWEKRLHWRRMLSLK